MAKPKTKSTAFAVIDTNDALLGYFKSLREVENYIERESIEECVILEIVAVIDAFYPPEPDLEFTDRPLSSLF